MLSIIVAPIIFILELLHLGPSDFLYWCKFIISYLYVTLHKWTTKARLDFFDYNSNDPVEVGFISADIERELESAQPEHHLLQAQDKIFCYGVNSKSECLIVSISRLCNERAEACIYLKLASGKIYELKETSNYQQPCSDKKVFSCGDLQVHYVSPMRRWRIFFSGFLKETSEDSKKEQIVYVKFSFIWRASTDVFDFTSDLNTRLLADGLAQAKWKSILPPLSSYQEDFNLYSQGGIITGTISIEGSFENQEIYLFGQRIRSLARREETEFYHALGYVHKNGTFVHFGTVSIKNIAKNLRFGYIVKPDTEIKALTEADIPLMKTLTTLESKNLRANLKIRKENPYAFSGSLIHSVSKSHCKDESGEVAYSNIMTFHLNGRKGKGLFIKGTISERFEKKNIKISTTSALPSVFPFVLPFTDEICQLSEITGGKGSSLAKLTQLSKELRTFIVPSGLVVTTSSYKKFLTQKILQEIEKLENVLYGNVTGDVKEACQRVSKKIVEAKIPDNIQHEIAKNLRRIFGERLQSQKFAVRSSATGEDTEQMSAAGQMETFLGVSGVDEILSAVKKCWASQFGYVAVQYKRRYGQIINSPMAVVIQEMVSCDVAGVLFTCDPLTGSPTVMTITANYGLGESVVSGSEEPDTIELGRDYNDKLVFKSSSIGAKSRRIVMKDGGTSLEDVSEEERKECCLSQENALRLGELAVKIEKHYRSKRDIEWGFWYNNLYIFQSRPVTSENQETDFEIEHELDGPLRIENDYFSVSNTGEVLPGAMSTLGYDVFFRTFTINIQREKVTEWVPIKSRYFPNLWVAFYNHIMFNVADLFRSKDGEKPDSLTQATMIAFLGRILDEGEIAEISAERHAEKTKQDALGSIHRMMKVLLFSNRRLKNALKYYENHRVPIEKCKTSEDVLNEILKFSCDSCESFMTHLSCSQASTVWNMFMLSTLVKARKGLDEDVYKDFASLLTTSSYVESADVPSAIQNMAYHIAQEIKPEAFKKMQLQEALQWLNNSSTKASSLFREFLEKHGHRCVKEFDISSVTWGTDPRPLVKLLQNLVGTAQKDNKKESISINKVISQLTTPLGIFARLKLRILVPLSQNGVQKRECSKSLIVKEINGWRKGFQHLAKRLVSEGRIPDENILFFMNVEDIAELLRTRSPNILAKAYHRQKLYPQMDKYQFAEIIRGIPKPLNDVETLANETGENFEMKGIPVSQGIAKGFVRVAICLDDAADLKPGEILLAYSTDIGWSPYFPIVAGVVTELGGLISHGILNFLIYMFSLR